MNTKICTKCRKEKDIGKFNWKNKSKGYKCSWCKICMKNYHKKYYEDNIEQCKEYSQRRYKTNKKYHNEFMKQWRKDNKDYYKEYQQNNLGQVNKNSRKWRKNNIEQCKEYNKQYKMNNRDKSNTLEANRRAMRINQTPNGADKKKIGYIYFIARGMTEKFGKKYHVDHIYPLSKGGLHHEDNLQILPSEDNLKKGNKITSKYKGLTLKECKKIMGDL